MEELFQNRFHRMSGNAISCDMSEIYRYLGYRNMVPDQKTQLLIDESLEKLVKSASPRAVYAFFPIDKRGQTLDLGFAPSESRDIARHLRGCSHAAVFAATIGAEVDAEIIRAMRISPPQAVVMNAVGSMLVESYCDLLSEEIKQSFSADFYEAKSRFSPGYGDFPLEFQRCIFDAIDCRKIGLTLMESMIMAPEKSVTAIIGAVKTEFGEASV